MEFLAARNIIIPYERSINPSLPKLENPLDVFHWHFDPSLQTLARRLGTTRIAVVSINTLSQALLSSLRNSGFLHTQLIDHPHFRNEEMFSQMRQSNERPLAFDQWSQHSGWNSVDCIVVCSDIGGRDLLQSWNDLCLTHGKVFLPVVLENLIGYAGPIVIPHETACYECLIGRENSQLRDALVRRAVERVAPAGRDVAGFHPTMVSVLANLAAFELVRFYGECFPGQRGGVLVEMNLLTTTVTTRRVLKLPRCPSCSPMRTVPSVSPYREDLAKDATTTLGTP